MDSASSRAVWEYWREYWAASQRLGFWLQLPRIIYSVTLKFGARFLWAFVISFWQRNQNEVFQTAVKCLVHLKKQLNGSQPVLKNQTKYRNRTENIRVHRRS